MTSPQTALPSVTRWLVILTMAFVVFAGVALLFLAGVIAWAWPMVLAEIATEHALPADIHLGRMQVAALAICLIGVGLTVAVAWSLNKLRQIVDTVRDGDPFVQDNATRLRAIGWVMVGIQVAGLPIGILAKHIERHFDHVHLDAGFSLNGLLAILLIFVLAQVFEKGAAMRDDLEGTV
jgi:hypothetical protein